MLKNAWAGNEPLWKVWWGLGIPMGATMVLINACVRYVVQLPTPNIFLMPLLCVQIALVAAWVRTAWICAPNVRHRLWMYLARIWLVLWLLSQVQQALQHG
ncbi:Uncharacterised protein [Burkholderia pseudomallei]|nr:MULTISPECIES: hypothetical protein [Burkholderia]KGR95443.1 putative membrane protein [Burkholderia pseudomallei MSHR7504]KGV37332.1 putative membrane protein [Burkholderia pseudomallei MSHR4012]KGV59180.1 putative membrane protein [Burkholderia pseudomallei MSHR4003]KGV79462.1 putative membrane protein [Burkholderia pseudomallei MSHR4375]KGX75849.1 putative membrane protein [Burkholderia pseudomallei MSHR435]